MPNAKNNVVISLKNLTKNFGDFTAVSGFTLQVKEGEIIGLIGPNGAGKTTTMKMISRLLIPNEGEVWIKDNGGLQLLTRRNMSTLLDHIGFLIENPTFYDHMTPRQILTYFATLKGVPKKQISDRIDDVLAMVELSDWIDKKTRTFSKGMKQKLGIVSSLIHDPDVLILDEPQTGLDPKARREIRDLLINLKNNGKTIFLSSHLLYEVSEISDRIAIINQGKLIAFDTIKNLETQTHVSTLQIQLLKTPVDIGQKRTEIEEIVKPHSGIKNGNGIVSYNPEQRVFEVRFNGDLKNQSKILTELMNKGIDVVDFSVPRANTLEDLYIKLIAGKAIETMTTNETRSD